MAKTILITGASSGIGKATAAHFAKHGWNVVATMRQPAEEHDLAAENVLVTRLDVLDDASIASAVAEADARFGGVDVLLNNAGYGAYGALEATSMEVVRRQFDVNLFGLVAVTKAVLPNMRAKRNGVIVNVSSVGGRMCYPLGALYHGSKWAVEGLSEALHYELAVLGIRVKLVEPGGVDTDFGGRSFVFTNDESLAEYQPMVSAMVSAREAMDTRTFQKPSGVAEVIWEAVHDPSARLRYVSGEGAKVLLEERFSLERDEAFLAAMRKRFGIA
ncbi:MAG: SDR family oxidoreductase [Sandaracinus sp.]|nr:SDR family oxidoreductase [Sandaracinus sp.]